MKLKKTLSITLILILLTAMFSSCGYRLVKIEDIESTSESTTVQIEQTTITPETTTFIEETTDPADYTGITVNSDYRSVAMSTEEVVDMYADAVNNVKLRCPGFNCSSYQEIENVSAGDSSIQLADRILELVASEVISSEWDYDITVQPYDDIKVREYFPVFGEDYACAITDYSIISSAACYTNGDTYKLVITLADSLNPEPATSEFGKIMTPVERAPIANAIKEYVVVLDANQYQFDINYTGNEITCVIDRETNRLVSLSQKMIMQIDIDLNLDLILFKTTVVEASGTIINYLDYNNFVW